METTEAEVVPIESTETTEAEVVSIKSTETTETTEPEVVSIESTEVMHATPVAPAHPHGVASAHRHAVASKPPRNAVALVVMVAVPIANTAASARIFLRMDFSCQPGSPYANNSHSSG
jgi:hypothetical protein